MTAHIMAIMASPVRGGAVTAPNGSHIYNGAQPHRHRQGTHVAGADVPPTWDPEQARDVWFPYTLREYMRDADRWCHATKVPPERRGPLLSLAVGGAARTIAVDIDTQVLVRGATCDIRDGQGPQARTGPEMLFLHLLSRFPDNEEALMLRAGLEFFGFTPSRSEDILVLMLRFDTVLERANARAELGISFPLRAWMLLSLLRLPTKKWAEYLKAVGHRFPKNESEYSDMKLTIVRERVLEQQVGDLTIIGDGRSQGPRHLLGRRG